MRTSATPPYGLAGSLAPAERLLALPVTFTPTTAVRLREGGISFLLSPLALSALLLSANSLAGWAAVGQPLSSPEATLGIAISGFLFLRIGMSATRTTAGLLITSIWALVIAVLAQILFSTHGAQWIVDPGSALVTPTGQSIVQLILPLSWSALPTLLFCVSFSAFFAARMARKFHRERMSQADGASAGPSRTVTRTLSIMDLLAAALVWLSLLEMAPRDVSLVAVYGPPALGLSGQNWAPILLAAVALTLLTLSAAWSLLETAGLSTLLLVAPAAVVLPLSASLTGTVATPGAPESTALSLAGPVAVSVGVLLVCLTWGLHWVQTATPQNVLVCD